MFHCHVSFRGCDPFFLPFFEIRKKFQGFFSGVDTESQPLENVCLGGSQMTQQDGVQSTLPHT